MNNEDDQRVVRLSQHRQPAPDRLPAMDNHGPVSMHEEEGGIQVLTFEGTDESDVLHAAGTWVAEHAFVRIVAANWKGDRQYEDHEDTAGTPAFTPQHRFKLIVDRDTERGQYRIPGIT